MPMKAAVDDGRPSISSFPQAVEPLCPYSFGCHHLSESPSTRESNLGRYHLGSGNIGQSKRIWDHTIATTKP